MQDKAKDVWGCTSLSTLVSASVFTLSPNKSWPIQASPQPLLEAAAFNHRHLLLFNHSKNHQRTRKRLLQITDTFLVPLSDCTASVHADEGDHSNLPGHCRTYFIRPWCALSSSSETVPPLHREASVLKGFPLCAALLLISSSSHQSSLLHHQSCCPVVLS